MPRRANGQPKYEIQREMSARWKYVLRHPEFRKDVRELRARYQRNQHEAAPVHKDLIEKWRLKDLPFDILTIPYISDEPPYKNAYYETICPQATVKYPVETHMLSDTQFAGPHSSHIDRSGQFLQITIDLSYPDTQLLCLIAEEISALRGQRRRRDKHDHYLKAYDLAEQGKTIRQIAADTGSKIPTVKSRLRTACERIYGPGNIPPKWKLALSSFNAETHLAACQKCRKAFGNGVNWSEDELCPRARRFFRQDHVSQRELPHQDVETVSPRRKTRRVGDSDDEIDDDNPSYLDA